MQWLDHLQQIWEYEYISLTSNFWKKLKCRGLNSYYQQTHILLTI